MVASQTLAKVKSIKTGAEAEEPRQIEIETFLCNISSLDSESVLLQLECEPRINIVSRSS